MHVWQSGSSEVESSEPNRMKGRRKLIVITLVSVICPSAFDIGVGGVDGELYGFWSCCCCWSEWSEGPLLLLLLLERSPFVLVVVYSMRSTGFRKSLILNGLYSWTSDARISVAVIGPSCKTPRSFIDRNWSIDRWICEYSPAGISAINGELW